MARRRRAEGERADVEAAGGPGLKPGPLPPFWTSALTRWRVVGFLVCLILGALAGTALASWRTGGSGSGTASTGSLATVSVAAFTGGDAPNSLLLPGGTSDVILRITNTNTYSVTLTSIALAGSIVSTGAIGACTTTGVSLS